MIYKHFPSAFPPPTLTDQITDITDKIVSICELCAINCYKFMYNRISLNSPGDLQNV